QMLSSLRKARSRGIGLNTLLNDRARLLLHRAALLGGLDAQAAFGLVVEVADGDAGHGAHIAPDSNDCNAIIAINAITKPISSATSHRRYIPGRRRRVRHRLSPRISPWRPCISWPRRAARNR